MFDRSIKNILKFCNLLLLSYIVELTDAQDACSDDTQDVTQMVLVKQALHVKTYVPENTTLSIYSDLSLAVRNAPTSLDFITTHTSTKKYSRAHTSHSQRSLASSIVNVPPATPSDFPPELAETSTVFALAISLGGDSDEDKDRRRQALPTSPGYLGFDGLVTTACSNASTYSLLNGQLIVQ